MPQEQYDSYEVLIAKNIQILPVLNFHFGHLLKSVLRKITRKQTLRRPGFLEASVLIEQSTFIEWFYVVRDFHIKTFRYIKVERNNDKSIKVITIIFHHIGPLSFHLGKAFGLKSSELQQKYFKKTWTNGKGELVATECDPIVLQYVTKTGKLIITGHFVVKNIYGNICV